MSKSKTILAQNSKRKAPRKKAYGFLRGKQSHSVKLKANSKIIPNYFKVFQIIPNQYQIQMFKIWANEEFRISSQP